MGYLQGRQSKARGYTGGLAVRVVLNRTAQLVAVSQGSVFRDEEGGICVCPFSVF